MQNTRKPYIDGDMSFDDMAIALHQKPTAIHMVMKRALEKAKKKLTEKGYKMEDFFKD